MAKQVDWEAIEREYRAGQLSVREIAKQHGVSHVSIGKRAKANGWSQDLSKQVRNTIKAKLVTSEVTTPNTRGNQEAIDAAAARGVEVVRQHRLGLQRLRNIADKLTGFLETMLDDLQQNRMVEIVTGKDPDTKEPITIEVPAPGAWIGQIERESPGDLLKKLADVNAKIIADERKAFNLDEPEDQSKAAGAATGVVFVELPSNGRDPNRPSAGPAN